jgi:hypothetical protein
VSSRDRDFSWVGNFGYQRQESAHWEIELCRVNMMAGPGRSQDVERSVQELESKPVRCIVLSARQEKLDQYPAALGRFLAGHYHLARTFSDADEVWEREPL